MRKSIATDYQKQGPAIQMAPLIDIVFNTLVVFMAIAVFSYLEREINISVPKAKESKDIKRTAGEIIINISKDGRIMVNQKVFSYGDLKEMLKKVSELFPDQPVIVRADEKTYHKYVVNVLDACAGADIWNISFATQEEEKPDAR